MKPINADTVLSLFEERSTLTFGELSNHVNFKDYLYTEKVMLLLSALAILSDGSLIKGSTILNLKPNENPQAYEITEAGRERLAFIKKGHSANPSSKTFICYSRSDSEFALQLSVDLRNCGYNIWMAQLDINPGDRWAREVERALHECENFLVILSPPSIESDDVDDQISVAIEEKKRIIPVMVSARKLPLRIGMVQYIDFTKNYDDGFKMLKSTLDGLTGLKKMHEIKKSDSSPGNVASKLISSEKNKIVEQFPSKTKEEKLKKSIKTFICYAREPDSDFALKLAEDLRHQDLDIWMDQLDLDYGLTWDDQIEKALTECENLLVILSPGSVASANVKDEVSYFLRKKKKIVTLLLEVCEVPYRIERIQRIDFTKSYEDGLKKLIKALSALR